ncbi:tRNA (adenosine(37)-N6)-threonylcarbamoyltransferase complex dimerization subunit type 1 TsaB [Taibaiella lutea]|uniref:tRNA (Adenosine(37)-N6)-threonylcarbamoyltransferase complex dimerization subunit type 1 TsaB n=1 Tax=Taibaiella lutea TaxID=2608001 RepID=A0A5M6CDR6_9BACT|nr:tRNA (adenosine(37)-N6)-threonylcarbamoyltransferase complex dimerization subunit type 1 TsaB [Taibaiella lutea]KAA5533197.1 tRNA (adenosine(37)-N6)-threonylcarbamoyltransferase complex dimerization subunit type 1 TsaB [Taibaiella lutea]
MSKLLFIDTSASVATVALSIDAETAVIRTHENANEQAAVINFMIEEVLQKGSSTINDIDAICVCAGPGSYTGLRVGLSTAKGLAYASDKPLMLFNRLDILSWNINADTKFIVALKARTGEYFIALFDKDGNAVNEPQHAFEKDLAEYTIEGFQFFTDDEHLSIAAPTKVMSMDTAIDVRNWITKATVRFTLKQFDDLAYSEPFYLKAAYTTVSKK